MTRANGAEGHAETTIALLRAPSMVFTFATAAVGVANFAYHPLVSHRLSVNEYGALGALLGFLMVLAVPVATMQIVLARDISGSAVDVGLVSVRRLFWKSVALGVCLSLLTAATLPLLVRLFDLPSGESAMLLAATVLPTVVQVVPIALLLSRARYGLASIAIVAGALVRLAMGNWASDHFGLAGAMAANFFGATTAALIAIAIAKLSSRGMAHDRQRVEQPASGLDLGGALVSVIGLTGFWALHAVHPMIARVFLSGSDSGDYVAAATLGQLSVFVPALVAIRVFPHMAEARGKGPVARAHLLKSMGVVAPIAIALALVTTVFGSDVVRIVLGSEFRPSLAVLGFVSFASAIAALVYLIIYFFLAGRSRAGGIVAWGGVVVFALLALWAHGTPRVIALLALLTTTAVFLVLSLLAITKGRAPMRALQTKSSNLWSEQAQTLDLTMVVPFYNPGPGFVSNVIELAATLEEANLSYEIIAVSDGSTDNSAEALESLRHQHVRLVRQPRNAGKGQALRVGLAMGRGQYLGFIDADGDIAPEVLASYLVLMRTYQPDIIFGSKRHPMSQVDYPVLRRLYSFGYQQIIRWLFRVDVRDTQVGLKLVRRDVLAAVLPRMLEKRFAFDLELFVVSRHVGFRRVFEAPVVIKHGFTSTVSWRSVRGVFLDTAAIFYRLHLLHFYDEPQLVDVNGAPVVTRSTAEAVEIAK